MKNLPLVLALALAASSLRAQTVRVSPASAWTGPLVGAMSDAGRPGAGGSVSLGFLSKPDLNGTLPFVSEPRLVEPLVALLQKQGFTPEAFNGMSPRAKADALAAAAARAEAAADEIAARAVAASQGVTAARYEDAKSRLVRSEALSIYLKAERRSQVAAARAALVAALPELQAQYDAYERELAAKIAAGALTGANFIRRTPDGWTAGDESPEKTYGSLRELYEHRLARLENRSGPWSPAEAGLIKDSLFRLDVARRLEKEKPGSLREIERLATAREQAARSWETSYDGMNMVRTSMRFTARRPRAVDFDELSRLYAWALDYSANAGERAHKLAAIVKGAGGIPGWARVEELRSGLHRGAAEDLHAAKGFVLGSALVATLISVAIHSTWLAAGVLVPFWCTVAVLLACLAYAKAKEYDYRRGADQDRVDGYLSRSPVPTPILD